MYAEVVGRNACQKGKLSPHRVGAPGWHVQPSVKDGRAGSAIEFRKQLRSDIRPQPPGIKERFALDHNDVGQLASAGQADGRRETADRRVRQCLARFVSPVQPEAGCEPEIVQVTFRQQRRLWTKASAKANKQCSEYQAERDDRDELRPTD